ncbi:MAG: Gfo/Idh/MocA family oxidoreductase [Gemmataceae bacterium]|nr:Gfo/Idh/MocA family oxidoreductase [Gemmataceae bacterium]
MFRSTVMRTIGYGVIGLGFFGEKHAEVAAALPDVELRALCTRQDDRRRQLKKRLGVARDYKDYHDLLADPDVEAVSIVTHVDQHVGPAVDALRAGKHVLLEKPMARTVAECDRIIAAAEKSDRILMVGHICRFNPRYALARERIVTGELGQIVSMYARRNIPAARSRSVLEKIGPLLGDGIHDTDLMLWMSGARIETAYALTHTVRGLPNPDLGWAMYRFHTGAIGVIEDVWFLPEGTPFRIHEHMEIIGTDGAIYIHGGDMNLVVQGRLGIDCPDTLYWPQMHGEPSGALRTELAYFVDCVAKGTKPSVVTPLEARAAVAALGAAEKSARTGKVVRVRGR